MNTQLIMDYLSALSMHNNCEWYHANKEDFQRANAEFEKLLQVLFKDAAAMVRDFIVQNEIGRFAAATGSMLLFMGQKCAELRIS